MKKWKTVEMGGNLMKVAAVQMTVSLAQVEKNLEKAERLLVKAFEQGCEMVILPEFFNSAVAFHDKMLKVASQFEGPTLELMTEMARRYQGYIGGSFIANRGGENYNNFVLVFPDGSFAIHDKDQPTMWENCYYRGGNDDGVVDTPLGPVGIVMCWEMIRTRAIERLRGKIDLLVGGSCWWTLPDGAIPLPGKRSAERCNREIMRETPARLARLLGVPVIHAAHAGSFEAAMPLVPFLPYRSSFLGETQIVDGQGNILSRLSQADGEGLAIAEIEPGRVIPSEELPPGFWIPELPALLKMAWNYQNWHGVRYYNKRHKVK